MLTDTLTVSLLDREVVITETGGQGYWLSDDASLGVSRWGDGRMTARLYGIDLKGEGEPAESDEDAIREAVADLDAKLRRLREWLR